MFYWNKIVRPLRLKTRRSGSLNSFIIIEVAISSMHKICFGLGVCSNIVKDLIFSVYNGILHVVTPWEFAPFAEFFYSIHWENLSMFWYESCLTRIEHNRLGGGVEGWTRFLSFMSWKAFHASSLRKLIYFSVFWILAPRLLCHILERDGYLQWFWLSTLNNCDV